MTTTIPSRYNFVPLSEKIYFPDWSAQVCHDIPFRDGISGTFKIKITAETPIYTRNGGPKEDEDSKKFFQVFPGSIYAVNGSTFKGMLRNIVEIASFGKLKQEKDRHLSYRDLYYLPYTKRLTHKDPDTRAVTPKANPGWLTQGDNGEWYVEPCEFSRVEVSALEDYYHQQTRQSIDLHSHSNVIKNSAPEKYAKWNLPLDIMFSPGPLVDNEHDCNDHCHHSNPRSLTLLYRRAADLGTGSIPGRIVMTGQPATWKPGKRHIKHMEFIFYPRASGSPPVSISPEIKSHFIAAHSSDTGKPNDEWKFMAARLNRGESVPIFFLETDSVISDIGLAMMMRVLYRHPVSRLIANRNPDHLADFPLDLAETIFGRTGDDDHCLRGRVSIEPLLLQNEARELPEKTIILGSPRPSYYPNYIEQPHVNRKTWRIPRGQNYKTCEDDKAMARGWKRYPVSGSQPPEPEAPETPPPPPSPSSTSFIPLAKGACFVGTVHIHNLRPSELGALIWALTWGGDENKRHNIGMAKPYNYGVIKVAIEPDNIYLQHLDQAKITLDDLTNCRNEFAQLMEGKIPGWRHSGQLTELLAMAGPDRCWPPESHDYPSLAQFARFKRDKKILRRHSANP